MIDKNGALPDTVFAGCSEKVKARAAGVIENSGGLTGDDLERWHETMYLGALRAGHLVSGRIEALFNFLNPEFAGSENIPADFISDMVKKDPRLKEGLRFALSRRYEIMRQVLGLEL